MSQHRAVCLVLALALVGAACAGGEATPHAPSPVRTAEPPTSTTPLGSPARPEPATDPASSPAAPTISRSPTSPPATFDPQAVVLSFEPFAAGLGNLTFLTHAGDGTGLLYAVEQAGAVRVIERDGSIRPQPLIDIGDRVSAGGERGLLGLAFHPDYAQNGRLFLHYTDTNRNTAVSEFSRVAEAQADPASERRIFSLEQPFGNHNGGMLAFGPDGYLYISLGDGGGAGDPLGAGQDLATPLGKILRIDVDVDVEGESPYAIPPDNPFVGQEDARPEIWALGLRNPWRLSFDRGTGALVIADVGQGEWEEINVQPPGAAGRNYGWSIMEGPACFAQADCASSGLVPPVAWYPLDGGRCAVVGGYTYRGSQHPVLHGAYLFADHCTGLVWAFDLATALDDGQPTAPEVGSAGLRPSAFGEDEDGELYLVGHGGEILRITARSR